MLLLRSSDVPAAIDCQQNIYFFPDKHKMCILQINDENQGKLKITNYLNEIVNQEGWRGVIIKNEFHIIGYNKHPKYNRNSRSLQVLHANLPN